MNAVCLKQGARIILAGLAISLAWATPVFASQPERENIAGVETSFPVVRAENGASLQAIVTKPPGGNGKLPAIYFVQWLSCSTISIPAAEAEKDGWSRMLEAVIQQSGAIVWRTEKRGVGGSTGNCGTLDYETELSDHEIALKQLLSRPDVDRSRVVILGGSMGATMAPLLAENEPVAGVAVWGGGARTWFERMASFERNRIELGDIALRDRASQITSRLDVLAHFLLQRETPAQFSKTNPSLSAAWKMFGGNPRDDSLYGRSFNFHWQAQDSNWLDAWSRVRAPALAMVGEFDWFEDPASTKLIERTAHGQFDRQVAVIPGLNHHFERFANAKDAYLEQRGQVDPEPMLKVLLPWLQARLHSQSPTNTNDGSTVASRSLGDQ